MLKNHFVIGFRRLWRNKLFTLLNIFGLASGMAVSFLLFNYSWDELNYDCFHVNKDRIYRVAHVFYRNNEIDFESARTFPRVGPAMVEEIPGVESYCRIFTKYRGGVVQFGDRTFKETDLIYADSSFLSLFSYEIVAGSRKSVLRDAHTALIAESLVSKYFGNTDPIGKRIKVGSLDGNEEFEITGVIRSPAKSHLHFAFVFSYPSLVSLYGQDAHTLWGWYDFLTYVKLSSGVSPESLESKLTQLVDKHGGERLGSKRIKLIMQPLESIHLHSHLMMEASANGDSRTVYFLMFLAAGILVIAWVNYINLSTAQAIGRAKEVGLRKVMGSSRRYLLGQFIVETILVNFIAWVASFALMYLLMPVFSQITGTELSSRIFFSAIFWVLASAIFLLGSFFSGAYPAFVLSAYQPTRVLSGRLQHSKDGILLRKTLVVVQFAATSILIASTIVISHQLEYLQDHPLGANIDQTIVVKAPDVINNRDAYYRSLETFKTELLKSGAVTEVTISSDVPGRKVAWYNNARRLGHSVEQSTILYAFTSDHNYFKVFNIPLLAGRSYSEGIPVDTTHVILNFKAIQQLGFQHPEQAIGERIIVRGDTMSIIGVVSNYYHDSAKEDFKPTAYFLIPEERSFISIKFDQARGQGLIERCETLYRSMYPGLPFEHFLLKDYYDHQFVEDLRFMKAFRFFSVMAILIALLGLLGLASFEVSQRMKEVGIRKVLGSSVGEIFSMFAIYFSKLVVIANVISIPITVWLMHTWLLGFEKRIAISSGVFLITGGSTIALALIAISYNILQAAVRSPVSLIKSD